MKAIVELSRTVKTHYKPRAPSPLPATVAPTMAAVRARFHFRVRGLLIAKELLGTRIEIQRGTRAVTVSFPSREATRSAALLLRPELFSPDDPAPTPTSASLRLIASMVGHSPVAQIDVIRVEVVAESQIGACDVREVDVRTAGPAGQKLLSSLRDVLDELYDVAATFIADLIERVRVEGRQHWLGIAGEPVEGIGWGDLIDLDANEVLPVDKYLERSGTLRVVERVQVIEPDQVHDLAEALKEPHAPMLAEALLADAFYYFTDAKPPDRPRTLLIAAVACEVKIKEFLRGRVAPEGEDLLELAIRNTRPTVALFGKVCKAVTGRSLSEEDRPLYNKLDDLFEGRNALAHHGKVPDDAQVTESLSAAREAFQWLDGL